MCHDRPLVAPLPPSGPARRQWLAQFRTAIARELDRQLDGCEARGWDEDWSHDAVQGVMRMVAREMFAAHDEVEAVRRWAAK